jgi:hypothetical protein
MNRLACAVTALLLTLVCSPAAYAQDRVLIDGTDQAYTVYAAIPGEKVEQVEAKLAGAPKEVALVEWSQFADAAGQYVGARIVRNDYPQSRTVEGVVALLRKYPGTPVGVTWNGGIAITYNDYQYAKRTYAQYKADPAAYERNRVDDPRRDPVRPEGHLGSLLGW